MEMSKNYSEKYEVDNGMLLTIVLVFYLLQKSEKPWKEQLQTASKQKTHHKRQSRSLPLQIGFHILNMNKFNPVKNLLARYKYVT